ncbi:MAG: hypothetical protein JKY98_03155 [Gammaproteobacteria bacterium]|nr:hypothetical protein [Gammaproteobacteria bacterium]
MNFLKSAPISKQTLQIAGILSLGVSALFSSLATGQNAAAPAIMSGITGHWTINEELSQNTDQQVEAAIKEAGGKVQRQGWFSKKEEDRYRGGPPEQELYDRISYDDILTINYSEPEFIFEYADNFTRIFHTDGRRQTTGVNAFFEEGGTDFSFANWDNEALLVEARPRDGGYTIETYTLQAQGGQLRVEMTIQPDNFGAAISLLRIYDRTVEP